MTRLWENRQNAYHSCPSVRDAATPSRPVNQGYKFLWRTGHWHLGLFHSINAHLSKIYVNDSHSVNLAQTSSICSWIFPWQQTGSYSDNCWRHISWLSWCSLCFLLPRTLSPTGWRWRTRELRQESLHCYTAMLRAFIWPHYEVSREWLDAWPTEFIHESRYQCHQLGMFGPGQQGGGLYHVEGWARMCCIHECLSDGFERL